MNIEDPIERLKFHSENAGLCLNGGTTCIVNISDLDWLLTAYEKEKNKNAKEIVYVDRNFIRKDRIKPIQIIDLDGKIHNVYKIEEENTNE